VNHSNFAELARKRRCAGVWNTEIRIISRQFVRDKSMASFVGTVLSVIISVVMTVLKEVWKFIAGCFSRPHRIGDNFETVDQVRKALFQDNGVENIQLIVAVDLTASNSWTGKRSFGGRSLHSLGIPGGNPYERAIGAIARTLPDMDTDGVVPLYGFGDSACSSQRGLALRRLHDSPEGVHGLDQLVAAYRRNVSRAVLAGPTSFAPCIHKAVDHVIESGNRFHVLLIVADGGISPECMDETIEAIAMASNYPLAIVAVGVGDGPWQTMKKFDDDLPDREFDNFQFVQLDSVEAAGPAQARDAAFALQALMEVPEQYKEARRLGLFERARDGTDRTKNGDRSRRSSRS